MGSFESWKTRQRGITWINHLSLNGFVDFCYCSHEEIAKPHKYVFVIHLPLMNSYMPKDRCRWKPVMRSKDYRKRSRDHWTVQVLISDSIPEGAGSPRMIEILASAFVFLRNLTETWVNVADEDVYLFHDLFDVFTTALPVLLSTGFANLRNQ